jgi:hypothetical protein
MFFSSEKKDRLVGMWESRVLQRDFQAPVEIVFGFPQERHFHSRAIFRLTSLAHEIGG